MKPNLKVFFCFMAVSSVASAQATAPKPPAVTAPTISAPQAPQTANPGNVQSRPLLPAAPLVATRFEEAAYKQQIDAGSTVLLVFSETNDPVWIKQAPVLQGVLKEAEFGRIAVFQIDTGATPNIADRFLVKSPGTLVVLKGGVERLRSTRMTKPDVIRKMLRLHNAL